MKTSAPFVAIALGVAICAPATGAEQEQDQTFIGQTNTAAAGADEFIWGDAREVFAALRRIMPEQAEAGFHEGEYVDQSIPIRRFPKEVLPSLNPFSDLDLYVVLSKQEAAIVLPRTRRVLKVYQEPAGASESIGSALAAAPPAADVQAAQTVAPAAQRDTHEEPTQAEEPARQPARNAERAPDPTPAGPISGAEPPLRTAATGAPQVNAEAPQNRAASDDSPTRVLLERADARRKIGDILGARQFLELATRLGSIEAISRLADTYNPNVLAAWGARGVRPDEAQAAKLYAEAKDRQSPANLSARAEDRRER